MVSCVLVELVLTVSGEPHQEGGVLHTVLGGVVISRAQRGQLHIGSNRNLDTACSGLGLPGQLLSGAPLFPRQPGRSEDCPDNGHI